MVYPMFTSKIIESQIEWKYLEERTNNVDSSASIVFNFRENIGEYVSLYYESYVHIKKKKVENI